MNGFVKKYFKNYFVFGFVLFCILSVVYCLGIVVYFGVYPYIRNSLRGEHYYERILKDKYGIDFGIKSMSSPLDGFFDFSSGGAKPSHKHIEAYPLSNPNVVFEVFDDMEKGVCNDDFVEVNVAFNISNELTKVFFQHSIKVYSSADFTYKDFSTNSIYFAGSDIKDYNISLSNFCSVSECEGIRFYLYIDKSSINDSKYIYDVINEFNVLDGFLNVSYDFCFFDGYSDEKNVEYYCAKAMLVFENKSIIFDNLGDIDFD